MADEQEFMFTLRSVSIHLIKHDQPLQQVVVPVVEAYEKGQWRGFSREEKLQQLDGIRQNIGALTEYYERYPHHWSKQRFAQFRSEFEEYCQELKQGP